MRWENPGVFWYLALVLALVIIIVLSWYRHEAKLKKLFANRVGQFLLSHRSITKRKIKIVLELIVIVLAILAWARPQVGQSTQKVKSQGVELIVAFDVSKSMLVEDIKPSRLEHAKNEVNRLLDLLSGDKVGLVAFAGSAVMQSPLTSDYSSVRLFLESLSPDSVTTGGTNFVAAIQTATDAIARGGLDPDEGVRVTRVVLIVTDGESTGEDALKLAREKAKMGFRIFTLGLGTRSGAPIPDRDEFGNLRGYKKDDSGKVVLSTTKEDALAQLAQAGGGSYYHSDFSGSAIKSIKSDLDKMEKAEFDTDLATQYDEKFQILLLLAVILSLLEIALSERRKPGQHWRGRFEVST